MRPVFVLLAVSSLPISVSFAQTPAPSLRPWGVGASVLVNAAFSQQFGVAPQVGTAITPIGDVFLDYYLPHNWRGQFAITYGAVAALRIDGGSVMGTDATAPFYGARASLRMVRTVPLGSTGRWRWLPQIGLTYSELIRPTGAGAFDERLTQVSSFSQDNLVGHTYLAAQPRTFGYEAGFGLTRLVDKSQTLEVGLVVRYNGTIGYPTVASAVWERPGLHLESRSQFAGLSAGLMISRRLRYPSTGS